MKVNSRMPKEEILNLLSNKSDQVSKLEAKIAGEFFRTCSNELILEYKYTE